MAARTMIARRRRVIRWSVCAAAVLAAACAKHPSRGDMLNVVRDTTALAAGSSVLGHAPIALGPFRFRGTNSGLKSRWPPVVTVATVTVTNVSQQPAALNVLGGNCEVLVRIYAHGVPLQRPVFDASGPGTTCYVPIRHYGLTPGQSVELHSAGNGPGIELAPGRYDMAAIVTVSDSTGSQRIEIPVGSFRVPPPYE